MFQRPSWRADVRVEVMATYFPYVEKIPLKAEEPQIGQWHEDVERKRESYHITIFPGST